MAFYDYPADHWPHIRTTNPIEPTFSTIRLRTKKTRACVSRATILTMIYKLGLSAEKGWLKLRGFRRLAEIINGVKFIYGIDEKKSNANRILSLLFNRAYFDINFQMFPGSVSLPITSPLPKPAAIIMISFVLMMNTWAFWLPMFPGTGCPVGVTMAMMHVVLWSFLSTIRSPKEVLEKIKQSLCGNQKSGHFIIAFYGVVHLPTRFIK